MPYLVTLHNKETERDIEMTIQELKYLKELLEKFDETKIDIDMSYIEGVEEEHGTQKRKL